MSSYVFDTSAIIALIKREEGADVVVSHLKGSIMASVNYSETVAVLSRKMPRNLIIDSLNKLIGEVIIFDESQAVEAGILYQKTKYFGLSLGDRACITLAMIKKLPILTADSIWSELNLDVIIKNIR